MMPEPKTLAILMGRIRRYRPARISDFYQLGIKLKFVGWGAFREVYRVNGFDLVVKFPISEPENKMWRDIYHTSKVHNLAEVRRIAQLSRVKELRPHLPKIHYYDKKSGVMIMTYYPKFKGSVKHFEAMAKILQRVVRSLTGVPLEDICPRNVHQGKRGQAILVDLGY